MGIESVRVNQISIGGFKSFREKAKIGPLTEFSCIIGPNGSGKSKVIVEAVAFVLGGGARTMRAKGLSALINEEIRVPNCKSVARVSLTLHTQKISSEVIKITRVLSSSLNYYSWKQNGNTRKISCAELQAKLLELRISTVVPERFIVMQSQQTVKIKQPTQFCKYLEILTGSSQYEDKIKELEKTISENSGKTDLFQEELSGLQTKIEMLQPEVEKLQRFNITLHGFELKKASFLKVQEKSLKNKLEECQSQKEKAVKELLCIQDKVANLDETLDDLKSEASELRKLSEGNRRKLKDAVKQHDSLRIKKIKTQVRMNSAEKDAKVKRDRQLKHIEELEIQDKNTSTQIEYALENIKTLQTRKDNLLQEKAQLELDSMVQPVLDDESLYEEQIMKAANLEEEDACLSVRISRLKEKLKAQEDKKSRNARKISHLLTEVADLEKEYREMIESRRDKEDRILALQNENLEKRYEIERIESIILPGLKKDLMVTELEAHNIHKRLESSQNRQTKVSKEDNAVQFLMHMLNGRMHGRLTDLARVNSSMSDAINSLFFHLVKVSTFVLEDRYAANEVLHYFEEQKIGLATCEILCELNKQSGIMPQLCDHGERAKPAMQFLVCEDKYRPVFNKYLRNWLIAESYEVATEYFSCKQNRVGHNVVTIKGEIFKQDGEVICARKQVSGRYMIKSFDGGMLTASDILCEERELDLSEKSLQLAERKSQLEENILKEERRLQERRIQERDLQMELARTVEEKEKQPSSDDILNCVATRMENKKLEILNLKRSIEDTEEDSSGKQLQELLQQHNIITSSLESLKCTYCKSTALLAKEKLGRIEKQLTSLDKEMGIVSLHLKSLHKKVQDIRSLIPKDSLNETTSLDKVREEFAQADLAFSHAEAEKNEILLEAGQYESSLAKIERKLQKCNKNIAVLRNNEMELISKIEELSASERSINNQMERVNDALATGSGFRNLEDEEDVSSLYQQMGKGDGDEEATLLALEEMSLNDFQRSINTDALEEDLECRKRESVLLTELENLSDIMEKDKVEKEALETQRFLTFKKSLIEINESLSKVYRDITRHGDAYLSFTEERDLLFVEGVHMQVRPDRNKWRKFNSLSGGQQALAAVALSFTLQSLYPSPFYFFDEIDAALDTKNAQLVAHFIKIWGAKHLGDDVWLKAGLLPNSHSIRIAATNMTA